MSLDVSLMGEKTQKECECPDCGNKHMREYTPCYYDSNITHNLAGMAKAAGIYQHLWRPEELGITKAKELIEPLTEGIKKLIENPSHYRKYNASNNWGIYEHFVPFVEGYLEACKNYPESTISVSR